MNTKVTLLALAMPIGLGFLSCVPTGLTGYDTTPLVSAGVWIDLLSPDQAARWQRPGGAGTAWKSAGGAYSVADGWACCNIPLANFVLEGEFLLEDRGAGGIVIRGDREAVNIASSGYGLRLDRPASGKGELTTGRFPTSRPAALGFACGQWQRLRVEAGGDRVGVNLGGRTIKFNDDRFRYGSLCFQGNDGLKFRQLRLLPLDSLRPVGQRSPWITLFDGKSMNGWLAARGSPNLADGKIVLNGDGKSDCTIIAKGVELKDGQFEVDVHRLPGQENDGPYTLSLRLPFRLNWTAIYFVCRPFHLEACRGSSALSFPHPEIVSAYARSSEPELWRFVLKGATIDCYRFGEKVLTYNDAEPRGGTVAVTASKCRLAVSAARYRPAEAPE